MVPKPKTAEEIIQACSNMPKGRPFRIPSPAEVMLTLLREAEERDKVIRYLMRMHGPTIGQQ